MALDFSIEFNMIDEPKIILRDTTTGFDRLNSAWLHVSYPDGISKQYGDVNNPIISSLGGEYEIEPRQANDGSMQVGTYVFAYVDADFHRTEKTVTLLYGAESSNLVATIDPFEITFTVTDNTDYSLVANSVITSTDYNWSVKMVDVNTQQYLATGKTINMISLAGAFDSRYALNGYVDVTYADYNGFTSVKRRYFVEETYGFAKPPTYTEIVAAIGIIKAVMDTFSKNSDEYERYFRDFRRSVTLLSHLNNLFTTGNDTTKARQLVIDIMNIVYSNDYDPPYTGSGMTPWELDQQFSVEWAHVKNRPELFDTAWDLIQNKPLQFPPEYHKHTPADVETHVFIQVAPSQEWVINHNLNKYPSVVITNNENSMILGDFRYVDLDTIVVSFNTPINGYVFLN